MKFMTLRFLWPCHTCHLLFLYLQRTFSTFVPFLSTLKALNFYYSYSPYYPPFYSTLHYPTFQHLKLILGNNCPLLSSLFVPVVLDQVPKPFALPIQLLLPSNSFLSLAREHLSLSKLLINELY